MADQVRWIPTSNEPIVVHYIAPARELLAPDMPAVDPAQLARASQLIEQHRQNVSPPEGSMTWTDCPRCPTSYVRRGNPGCPMCERLPCWWLEVATRIMPQGSFRCFVGDEEREHDQVRIATSAREITATRESFMNNGVVAALFTQLAGALVSVPTRRERPDQRG
jgi:hypothetical protein